MWHQPCQQLNSAVTITGMFYYGLGHFAKNVSRIFDCDVYGMFMLTGVPESNASADRFTFRFYLQVALSTY